LIGYADDHICTERRAKSSRSTETNEDEDKDEGGWCRAQKT